MNTGERDELIFKLVFSREHDGFLRNPGGNIANGAIVPDNTTLRMMGDDDLQALAVRANLVKSPSNFKADCEIFSDNVWVGVSLKSTRGEPASILNHTHRKNMMAVCNRVGVNFPLFDNLVNIYHARRKAGLIGEDVRNDNPNSPFGDHPEILIPIYAYFTCRGSGRGDSPRPATVIGVINNPFDSDQGIDYHDAEDYIRSQWPHIICSMRNHKSYTSSQENQAWEVSHGGIIKPQFHVRI